MSVFPRALNVFLYGLFGFTTPVFSNTLLPCKSVNPSLISAVTLKVAVPLKFFAVVKSIPNVLVPFFAGSESPALNFNLSVLVASSYDTTWKGPGQFHSFAFFRESFNSTPSGILIVYS